MCRVALDRSAESREGGQTVERIIQDGTRAGATISRVRALFKKEAPVKDWLDVNEVVHELTVFLRDEAMRRGIHMQTDLVPGLPKVKADRVQLQQVLLNLLMNGMDATEDVTDHRKELIIQARVEQGIVLVRVEDSGKGLDAQTQKRSSLHSLQPSRTESASDYR